MSTMRLVVEDARKPRPPRKPEPPRPPYSPHDPRVPEECRLVALHSTRLTAEESMALCRFALAEGVSAASAMRMLILEGLERHRAQPNELDWTRRA